MSILRSMTKFKVLIVILCLLVICALLTHLNQKKIVITTRLSTPLDSPTWHEEIKSFVKQTNELSGSVVSEKDLLELLENDCHRAVDDLRISVNGTSVLAFDEYKIHFAKTFIEQNANPFPKSKTPPKLESFEGVSLPDPKSRLNFQGPVNDDAINKDLQEEKERRLKLGDDDLLSIKEVKEEIENNDFKVPNLVHYIWFNCKKFYLLNYVCILSVFRYQKPKLILFHTNCEPEGEYWKALKHILGSSLKIVKRSPPETVWGTQIKEIDYDAETRIKNTGIKPTKVGLMDRVIEHRADVARLQIEMEVGGIYLDTDSAILRNSDELRKYEMVLPESDSSVLANNIILANRNAWFLRRWYSEYQKFFDKQWGFNSVLVPWSISRVYPDKIFVVKELLCRPNYKEVNLIYRELYDWHRNYMMHLYARYAKSSGGKAERSLKELAILNTTYGQISRHAIWGDEKPRDITNWIVTCNVTQMLIDAMK